MKGSLLALARLRRTGSPRLEMPVRNQATGRVEQIKHQFDDQRELDQLDSAVAFREGESVATIDRFGKAVRADRSPYRPTKDGAESMRLMQKYVVRMSLSDGVWCAVGHQGRAYSGRTSLIAICRAAAE